MGATDKGEDKRNKIMKKHDPGSEAAQGIELPFLCFFSIHLSPSLTAGHGHLGKGEGKKSHSLGS